MKPRTVFITLEVVTDIKLSTLKERLSDPFMLESLYDEIPGVSETFEIVQIQANVIKATK